MSFTKGFWVTIIIRTLNQLQDTQRTAWAGSRAERGDKPPPADASPITFLSNMSLSFRPRQPDRTQQENAWAFWAAEYKNASWSCHKAHTSLWMPRSGEMLGERLCRALTPPLSFIHSPSPHPAPTITVQSQAPKEAEIENTFSLKHSLNFMNSITLNFLSISWSEYCKTREKGGRGAVCEAAIVCHPKKRLQRHLQRGSDIKGLFLRWRK